MIKEEVVRTFGVLSCCCAVVLELHRRMFAAVNPEGRRSEAPRKVRLTAADIVFSFQSNKTE